jgi:RNA polymerase sigma-70 factor (ECF subfamily)
MNNDQCILLVAACRKGSRQAFDELLSEFEKPVFNAAFRMLHNYEEAQDVTQTTFMRAFEKHEQFDDSRKFFSWIYRIAINECINSRSVRRPQATLEANLQDTDDLEKNVGQIELHKELEEALMALSNEHRSVVVLKHFLGFSYEEISDILEVPEKTVKSRLHDGREHLRDALDRSAFL